MRSFPEVVRGGWYWNILRGRVISVICFIVICLCFVAHKSHCFQGMCVNPQALCVSRKADTTVNFYSRYQWTVCPLLQLFSSILIEVEHL